MATIALGIAGAQWGLGAVGTTSVTGILGTAVGGYLDSAFVMPTIFRQDSAEPSYGGLNLTAADEGSPIWRVHGEAIRVPGLVLFVNEPRAQSQVNRIGKRGETTTRTYYTDCVLGFGKVSGTEDNFVERVYVNNTLVIDQRSAATLTVRYGTVDVIGTGRVAGVLANWDQYATYLGGDLSVQYGLMSLETVPNTVSTTTYASATALLSGLRNARVEVTFGGSHGFSPGEQFLTKWTLTSGTASGVWSIHPWRYMTAHESDPTRAYTVGDTTPDPGTSWTVSIMGNSVGGDVGADLTVFDSAGNDITAVTPNRGTVDWRVYAVRELPNGRTQMLLYPSFQGLDFPRSHIPYWRQPGPSTYSDAQGEFWDFWGSDGQTLALSQARTPYNLSVLESGASQVDFGYGLSRDAGGTGTADQQPMPKLVDFVGDTQAPGYRDMFALAFEDWNLSSTGNALGNVEGVVRCDDLTLPEVVTNICATHGVDTSRLDVSGLSGTVRGYRYNGVVEGRQALQPLILAYDIRARETDDGIVMFHSESSPTLTIPESDWLGGGDQPRLAFRERNTQIKLRSVQVKFLDAGKDQAPGTVTEVRQSETGGETRVISMDNLVLTVDEARAIARRILRQTRAQRFEVEGALPMSYATLTENTVITTTANGRTWRFRTTRVDVGANWEVRVSGIQEEVYA